MFQPSAVRQNPIVLEIRENVLSDAGPKKQTIVGLSHRTSDAWRPPNASQSVQTMLRSTLSMLRSWTHRFRWFFPLAEERHFSPFISGTRPPARACMP